GRTRDPQRDGAGETEATMKLIGIETMSPDQVRFEVERGAKFVFYQYCISLLVVSLKRSSNIYFVRAGDRRLPRALGFTLISLLAGWWGIPWGPIWTIGTTVTNLRGGKDVTKEVMASLVRVAAA
ncbi:MAG TPA: hypothetical protein VFT43_07875, partial [Candidatus Polarisedimenticolia bacterium]|nr:hypothetical protein [Candidatus Polarisedimenticolia bacterium]